MRKRKWMLIVAALGLAVPGNSCGPFFTEVVFFNQSVPSDPAAYFNGHLGVVQSSFTARYLALAYRIFSGPPLTQAEKNDLTQGWENRQSVESGANPGDTANPYQQPTYNSLTAWSDERSRVIAEVSPVRFTTDRAVPGDQWDKYPNCLADAFAHAARTLAIRAREHAADKAALAEWVQGQDAVFSNCGDNGSLPQAASQPDWLAQDRAYQIAAAHFYRSEFDEAQNAFQQISLDHSSPWHDVAAYLVARCLIRKATLTQAGPAEQGNKANQDLLRQAAVQLRQVAQGGGPYAAPVIELLNLVELRTDPGVAAARLGDAISRPDAHLEQHLTDLSYLSGRALWFTHPSDARKSDLVDWAMTMEGYPPEPIVRPGISPAERQALTAAMILDHAEERLHATGNIAWLVAALAHSQTPAVSLLRDAAAVPSTSPAWPTVTYARLRALPVGADSRAEAEKAIAQAKSMHESLDTLNMFTIAARQKAETLQQFARLAPMEPSGESDESDDSDGPLPSAAALPTGAKRATMAGLPVNVQGVERLDDDSAALLNQTLPVKDMVSLVLEAQWPKQLRFELAMAAWTRAVLLDQPDQARRLTAVLIDGEPGWKSWLTAYDLATTPDERSVTALLALMRFPSVRPYVNSGAGREDGFVGYSYYRDNWWCGDMGREQSGADSYSTSVNYRGGTEITTPPQPLPKVLPPFVTPAMFVEASREWAELKKIGDAPEYFGKQSLAWVRAHPSDPRDSEVLGFAFRAMRNGCNLENSVALRRDVFGLLHQKYAASEWAKKYPDIESPDQ